MTSFLMTLISALSLKALAVDCDSIKPFKAVATQRITVTIMRFPSEVICKKTARVMVRDVQGREDEASQCLGPDPQSDVTCKTTLNGDPAEIQVTSSSWIQDWRGRSAREYRLQGFFVKTEDSDTYYDIVSSSLTFNLKNQFTVLEGSLETGTHNPADGIFLRVEFLE